MLKLPFFLSRAVANLRGQLAGFDHLLLFWSSKNQSNFLIGKEILITNAQAAELIGCSCRTLQRHKKKGEIVAYPVGQNQQIYIVEELLEAVKQIPSLAGLKPKGNSNPNPKVSIDAFLYDGYVLIDIRFLGWNCTAYCPTRIWGNQTKIKNLVKKILKHQHSRKPFKISPDEIKF